MAGFVASEMEVMEYDFTSLGEGFTKGQIPEPTPEQVAHYWSEYIGMLQLTQAEQLERGNRENNLANDGESAEQRDARLRENIAYQQEISARNVQQRRELLAELCSKTPSLEELERLPYRVLGAFEAYISGCLNPEAWSTATTP